MNSNSFEYLVLNYLGVSKYIYHLKTEFDIIVVRRITSALKVYLANDYYLRGNVIWIEGRVFAVGCAIETIINPSALNLHLHNFVPTSVNSQY